ncbi:MAG: thioredoxin family protein [Deltaproteobacteria bacterium]|nr:thioredoxin family protein [Nannocystaceae bacterium]
MRTALALLLVLGGCVDPPHGSTGEQRDKPSAATKPEPKATAPSNGFGEGIAWRGFDEGLSEASKLGVPLMMVVHASWCGQCKALKPAFDNPDLRELSHEFVMVNVDQDQVPKSQEFGPDGTYVPRVLFVDPKTLQADASLRNPDRDRTVYYYGPNDDIVAAMKKALVRHGST